MSEGFQVSKITFCVQFSKVAVNQQGQVPQVHKLVLVSKLRSLSTYDGWRKQCSASFWLLELARRVAQFRSLSVPSVHILLVISRLCKQAQIILGQPSSQAWHQKFKFTKTSHFQSGTDHKKIMSLFCKCILMKMLHCRIMLWWFKLQSGDLFPLAAARLRPCLSISI